MSDPKTAPNPDQGGSYTRDPDTGALTRDEATGLAQGTLRRHADDDAPIAGTDNTAEEA